MAEIQGLILCLYNPTLFFMLVVQYKLYGMLTSKTYLGRLQIFYAMQNILCTRVFG